MKKIAILLPLIFLAAGASFADVLVTVDGERIETRGPWKVKGGTVVYTSVNGVLLSLRLRVVDLEASRRATDEVNNPSPPPPPPPPPPAVIPLPLPEDPPPEGLTTITNDTLPVRKVITVHHLGLDIRFFDRAKRKKLATYLARYSVELLLIHRNDDLTTPRGVGGAAWRLEKLAEHADEELEEAAPNERNYMRAMVVFLQELAKMARNDPDRAARKLSGMVNAEDRRLSIGQLRAMVVRAGPDDL